MNPNWRSFLQSAGAVFDADTADLLHFGNAADELGAASQETIAVPLSHLAVFEANGEDAKSFLHSQLTSDVNHLRADQVQHAGWCSAKGRMQASFLTWRTGDSYRLALSDDLLEATQKRLQMFVLRAKVKLVAHRDALALIGIAGPQAAAALEAAGLPAPAELMTTTSMGDATVMHIDATRYIVCCTAETVVETWEKLKGVARPAGVPAWRWLDIRAAFPLVTLATKEEFVPQMADFEKIGGVSFHKGCYPGQEIVARTQYLGKVKRHLYRVTSAEALKAGDDLYSPDNPDQACGKVMTAAPSAQGGFEALAVIQSNFAGNVHLASREGPSIQATAVNP